MGEVDRKAMTFNSQTVGARERILVLLWDLDPAGLSEVREETRTEYDDLVSGVLALAPADSSGEKIGAWLHRTLEQDWGIVLPFDQAAQLGRRAHQVVMEVKKLHDR